MNKNFETLMNIASNVIKYFKNSKKISGNTNEKEFEPFGLEFADDRFLDGSAMGELECEPFILGHYKKYYEISAPVIGRHEEFFDIFTKYNTDSTVDYEVKYNPFGFEHLGKKYNFLYVNTFKDRYIVLESFDEARSYMSSDNVIKFEKALSAFEQH